MEHTCRWGHGQDDSSSSAVRSPAGSFPAPPQQASAAPGAQGQWGPFRGTPRTNSAILEGAGFGPNYWGGDGTTRVSGPWGIVVLGVPGLSLIVVQFWNV